MKQIVKYLSNLLLIASFSFLFCLSVNAKEYIPSSSNLTVYWTNANGVGGGSNVNNFSTISPNYPIIKKFRVYWGGDGFGNTDYTGELCFSTSFGVKVPNDFKTLNNYNRLTDWSTDSSSHDIRYVDVYHSNNHLYYTFYLQNKLGNTGFLFPNMTFSYSGTVNPYFTNENYTYSSTTPVTRFVPCSSVSDSMIDSEIDNLHTEIDKSFSDINNKIDDMQSSIIDNENQNHTEAENTRKGIWASLTEGLSNIGKWFSDLGSVIGNFFADLASSIGGFFSDLWNNIKSLFVGEEVCEETQSNYFTGYTGVSPDSNGWINFEATAIDFTFLNAPLKNLEVGKTLNVFVEIDDYSFVLGKNVWFHPIDTISSPQLKSNIQYTHQASSNTFESRPGTTVSCNGLLCNEHITVQESSSYFLRTRIHNYVSGSNSKIKYRILITDDMSMTLDNYEYFTTRKECHTEGGLFGMITSFMSNVGKWFSDLLTGLLEGLKALFIPDDEYFSTYFSSLYDFFTEKLGILMYPLDLFIDILNRFLNLSSDSTGLIHIPEISIPGYGLLVQERSFYLNENWNDGPLLTLYNVYKAFVTCFIGLCLANLARKKEKEIVEGSTT